MCNRKKTFKREEEPGSGEGKRKGKDKEIRRKKWKQSFYKGGEEELKGG